MLDAKDADSVSYAINRLAKEYGTIFRCISFITADNGSVHRCQTLNGLTKFILPIRILLASVERTRITMASFVDIFRAKVDNYHREKSSKLPIK